jgi:uncharacterized protein YdaU (DUF1376 family)
MNYYEHHLGDYMRDTAHLSLLEDGAYRRLLDAYYTREKPLPADLRDCCKLARATTKPERDAVAYVLREFFERRDDGHHQKRADEEIARFRSKSEKARASINARWERTRTVSGTTGERNTNVSPNGYERSTDDIHRAPVPSPQTPDTRHQSSYTNTSSVSEVVVGGAGEGDASPKQDARKRAPTPPKRPDDVDERVWQDWIALRKSKKAAVSETVLRAAQREADKAGMTLTEFLELWCLRGSQGLQADWIKPQERSAPGQQIETFRERDERLARERYEELTGRVHSNSLPQQPIPMADVIDITPARALLAKGAL